MNRLKVSEKERDNLSGSKQEAELFIEKEKDIRRKKNTLYQVLQNTASENVEIFSDRLQKANEKVTYERGKLAEIEGSMARIKSEYDECNALYNAVSAEQQQYTLVRSTM